MKISDLMSLHCDSFFSLLTAPTPFHQACHLYMMYVMLNYNGMQKDLLDEGGTYLTKLFSISYILNSRNQVVYQYWLISTCPM